jgi:hypothetical protein
MSFKMTRVISASKNRQPHNSQRSTFQFLGEVASAITVQAIISETTIATNPAKYTFPIAEKGSFGVSDILEEGEKTAYILYIVPRYASTEKKIAIPFLAPETI